MQPFIEEGEFQGHVTINITVLEDTDKIILNAHQELEISEGDISVIQFPSRQIVKKHAPIPTTTTLPETTTSGTSTVSTVETTTVKTTEQPVPVAPVPVGAARLVPVSSSFIPENACTSGSSCTAGSGNCFKYLG